MAFDAGMLACTLAQMRNAALGARIEKVYQPERDEIVLLLRSFEGGKKILINAGSNNSRIGFTGQAHENPQNPPMLCMLLRKYLQGSKLVGIYQEGFDRVAYLEFDTRDEMGFDCKRYLIVELMGKYSNMFFADGNKKIITALRVQDLSLDSARPMLAGMTYTPPPSQNKIDPREVDMETFEKIFACLPEDMPCDRAIVQTFSGVAPVVAREIVFCATGYTDTPVRLCFCDDVAREFMRVTEILKNEDFSPCIVYDKDRCVEYSYFTLSQYKGLDVRTFDSAGDMLDEFFRTRDNVQRVHKRASDILRLLTNAEARVKRKLDIQREELAACEKGAEYKKYGDLITANIYRMSRGDASATFDDYESMREDGTFDRICVPLDTKLSPAANAQRYYKKYRKSNTGKQELTRQIELGEAELEYVYTVFDALTHAETPTDLLEIRDELYRSGYASRMKAYARQKAHTPTVMQFETPDGARIFCGKNNLQNEYITHKLAQKYDYWFHVKKQAGSHVLMVTDRETPTDADFTTAAEIAALYSSAKGDNIAVDYTLAKNVKKPPSSKPGLVIYHTNWTAYVTPDADKIASMRKK